MLEYTKSVLQKVSFSRDLFEKELLKSFKWLNSEEVIQLNLWVSQVFGQKYEDIIA
ncbi:MAG: hypothetical protein HY738_08280, partial [Bacteroidia bacterium]|nr:hypothetical protein [Bacteroidia bacterium]